MPNLKERLANELREAKHEFQDIWKELEGDEGPFGAIAEILGSGGLCFLMPKGRMRIYSHQLHQSFHRQPATSLEAIGQIFSTGGLSLLVKKKLDEDGLPKEGH